MRLLNRYGFTIAATTSIGVVVALVCLAVFTPSVPVVHAQQFTGANAFNCFVTVSTATTIQAVGGSCVAPGANVRLYITDINFGTNAAGIAADSFPTLKTGTGGTCGASTSVVWQGFTAAAAQNAIIQDFTTPIKLPLNQELCWINSTAGSKTLQVHGYIAP